MKYILINILCGLALSIFCVSTICAQEVSDSSAIIIGTPNRTNFDYRVENLRNFLQEFNSPLAPYAQQIVQSADKNGLDYRLVPAISGVESTFAKNIPTDSYNAYGWANGDYYFNSWTDSIEQVSKTLKSGYIDNGAPTIAQIARRYAPPSAIWGYNVKYFIGKIDAIPLNFDII